MIGSVFQDPRLTSWTLLRRMLDVAYRSAG